MRRVRTLEGSAFDGFSKVGLGGTLGNFSKSGPSFLCAGCVLWRGLCLRIFSKVELGGPLGNFSNAGPSILCAGCVLGRLVIPFCAQAADFGDGGEGDDAGGGPSLHP